MPGIISDAWDWATTSPEFVKKRAKRAHESVESPSVFDSTAEKFGKPAIHAAIDTADTFATPADAAGLLVGGAGFAGAEIANRLRRLPRVSNFEHYIDAIRLGKTPAEATKIAASGGRTAADKRRIAEEVEAQFRTPRPRTNARANDPNFSGGQGNPEMAGSAGYPRDAPYTTSGQGRFPMKPANYTYPTVKNTAGRGKSVLDLAEAVRRKARNPYMGR